MPHGHALTLPVRPAEVGPKKPGGLRPGAAEPGRCQAVPGGYPARRTSATSRCSSGERRKPDRA